MSSEYEPTLAVTSGEPAGVGPELCAWLANQDYRAKLVVLGDADMLVNRGFPRALKNHITLEHVPLRRASLPGKLDAANAPYVLQLLDHAMQGCKSGAFDAIVTAPVHKGVINDAGIAFSGHTEYLAEKTHTPHVVMMLVGGGLRVALATTHLPLRSVADAINVDTLLATLAVLHGDLREKFGIRTPRILVTGLNPHAGESGHLGHEEIDVIGPAIALAQARGIEALGPFPADTVFTPQHLDRADCVLAMYHDQGLPVLKHASFGAGVNVTLGLPFIRTSVDHGTALDRAGTADIDFGSMHAAVSLAIELGQARNASAHRA